MGLALFAWAGAGGSYWTDFFRPMADSGWRLLSHDSRRPSWTPVSETQRGIRNPTLIMFQSLFLRPLLSLKILLAGNGGSARGRCFIGVVRAVTYISDDLNR